MVIEKTTGIPEDLIMHKIYLIRGKKVMLDRDLAELYGLETKVLKQSVRRNLSRFPSDFMFELTRDELDKWRSQFGTSNKEIMGLRVPPFAFSEHGVIMLASVLNSDRAISVNIQVVRIFTRMREMLASHKELLRRLDGIEQALSKHDEKFIIIFDYLKQLDNNRQQEIEQQKRERIGFRRKTDGRN